VTYGAPVPWTVCRCGFNFKVAFFYGTARLGHLAALAGGHVDGNEASSALDAALLTDSSSWCFC